MAVIFVNVRSIDSSLCPGRLSPKNVKMVGRLGIEPRTYWLKAKCSTIELTTHKNGS